MAKLTELTAEQEAALVEYRDQWLKIGLDTNPTNRAEAEAAVRLAYECGGLLPPKIIVWLRSPFEGAIGAAMFASLKASEFYHRNCHRRKRIGSRPFAIRDGKWELK